MASLGDAMERLMSIPGWNLLFPLAAIVVLSTTRLGGRGG